MLSFSRALQWAFAMIAFCFVAALPLRTSHAQSLDRPVVDRVGVLSPEAIEALEAGLRAHHSERGPQMAVLIVNSTDGVPIEDYAHRRATEWKLGKKGADDGVLFVLAVGDRRSRLEVGYGLEATLTDGVAKQILDSATPSLKVADYDVAVATVVNGVLTRLGGAALKLPPQRSVPTPPASAAPTREAESSGGCDVGPGPLFLLFMLAGFAFLVSRGVSQGGGGSTYDHSGYSSSSWDSGSSSSSYDGGGGDFGGGGASSSW